MVEPSPILFATGNQHKFAEAQAILEKSGIILKQYPHRPPELQADSLDVIAKYGCEQLLQKLKQPVFVEDAGLFIDHLNGFPGPYSSYVLHTLGNPGVLTLMKGVTNRTAYFRSAIAFASPTQPCLLFIGETPGQITESIRGTHWGFDPIFCPLGGSERTYAEMDVKEKNQLSHRAKALTAFADWLLKQP
jgi:XTP/dITP diphosphohydrolase